MMERHDPDELQRTRELLSGLIRQREELGTLGYSLVIALLSAGIRPAFQSALDSRFHAAPRRCQ